MQAAVPAPTNFTAADGGTSAGLNPTIFSQNILINKRIEEWLVNVDRTRSAPPKSEKVKKKQNKNTLQNECYLRYLQLPGGSFINPR